MGGEYLYIGKWRGFTHGSKHYMSYETMSFFQKVTFWARFPFVYFKFKTLEKRNR